MSLMTSERAGIVKALNTAQISSVLYAKEAVPASYPAAIVVLATESGYNATATKYMNTELAWSVYLVISALNNSDPDQDAYDLKEAFRAALVTEIGKDVGFVEYYNSQCDGRPVRVARMDIVKARGREVNNG